MAQAQAAMAAMPAEDRKRMDAMMADHGIKMGTSTDGSMNSQICISKEMAAQNSMPINKQGSCTETYGPSINGRVKMAYTCTNPESSGEGEFVLNGDRAFKMKMDSRTTVSGRTEKMTMESSGNWLGADCGKIKPLAMPKKAKKSRED